MTKGFALVFLLLFCACKKEEVVVPVITDSPNIILILADDLGKDALSGYSEGVLKPHTPHLDSIRSNGLAFSNMWVYPTCTPTRASLITGKYGYRTGVKWAADELSSSEMSLQQYISDATGQAYATAVIGKWHLSGNNTAVNPESFGIDYYAGIIRGTVDDYYQWQLTEDGATSLQTTYATEYLTDLSIQWVGQQSKPWFLWLAYNAPHTPFHVPPSHMHSQGSLPPYAGGMDPLPYYLAAIEAMDYQIGRLLDALPAEERANTVLIFLGDNGSPTYVAQAPYTPTTVKGTLYQGGINVPMFVSGKGVSRRGTDDNLVTGTDLFATLASLAGASTTEIHDSKSFKSLFTQSSTIRTYQYAEKDDGVEDAWTIRNDRYKLLVRANGQEEFYDLWADPYEAQNLLDGNLTADESNAKSALEAELSRIRQ